MKPFKLSPEEVKKVVDKVVPLVAEPEDYEYFKGCITLLGESVTSAEFAEFIRKLLKEVDA